MKHIHAEAIKAWADGAEIEYFDTDVSRWNTTLNPGWYSDTKYRAKPKSQYEVRYGVAVLLNNYGVSEIKYLGPANVNKNNNIKLTFEVETGKLKMAEVINERR